MNDEQYIDIAIDISKKAKYPYGAIVVKDNEIIGEGFNTRNSFKSVIGHAEIDAIEMACKHLGDWRLDECIMFVTLSPCMMCTGAILESRIKKVYYLCDRTNVQFKCNDYINIEKIVYKGINDDYMKLLQLFFENKRNK